MLQPNQRVKVKTKQQLLSSGWGESVVGNYLCKSEHGIVINLAMLDLLGKEVVIDTGYVRVYSGTKINCYHLKATPFIWSEDMLDLTPKKQRNLPEWW